MVSVNANGHSIFGKATVAIMPGTYVIGKHKVSPSVFLEFFTAVVNPEHPENIFLWRHKDNNREARNRARTVIVWIFPGSKPKVGPSGCDSSCLLFSLKYLKQVRIVHDTAFAEWMEKRSKDRLRDADSVSRLDSAISKRAGTKARTKSGAFTYKNGVKGHALYIRGLNLAEDGALPGVKTLRNKGVAVYGKIANAEGTNVAATLKRAMIKSKYNVQPVKSADKVVVDDAFNPKSRHTGLPNALRARGRYIKYSTFLRTYGLTHLALAASGATAAAAEYGFSDISAEEGVMLSPAAAPAAAAAAAEGEYAGAGALRTPRAAPKAKKKRAPTAYNKYISTRSKEEQSKMTSGKWDQPTMTRRFAKEWNAISTKDAMSYFNKMGVVHEKAFKTPLDK